MSRFFRNLSEIVLILSLVSIFSDLPAVVPFGGFALHFILVALELKYES